jgi:hypothetical protein
MRPPPNEHEEEIFAKLIPGIEARFKELDPHGQVSWADLYGAFLDECYSVRNLLRDATTRSGALDPAYVKALSKFVAAEASEKDGDIRRFRADVLHGELLEPGQVKAWITRQKEQDGPATHWVQFPVPAGHEVKSGPGGSGLYIDPPLTISSETPLTSWELNSKSFRYRPPGDESVKTMYITRDGTLDQLAKLSEKLAKKYYWPAEDVPGFLLADIMPLVAFSSWKTTSDDFFHSTARISLTLDPQLSPADVAAIYYWVREQVKQQRKSIPGLPPEAEPRPRALSRKHLQIALFWAGRNLPETMEASLKAWNARCTSTVDPKKWTDKGKSILPQAWRQRDEKNFRRDCNEAKKHLLQRVGLPQ